MKTIYCAIAISVLIVLPLSGQFQRLNQDSLKKLTNEDYRQMLELLKISDIRPGPSGNASAPNAANSDESKATRYASLPDPLVFDDGSKVKSAGEWWNRRRQEIVNHFDREIYGIVPADVPSVSWVVVSSKYDTLGTVVMLTRRLAGHVNNSRYPDIKVTIDLSLSTPLKATHPVPVIMEFGFLMPAGFRPPASNNRAQSPRPQAPAGPSWQQQLAEAGWGYAIIVPASYQADNGAGLKSGIIGLTNRGAPRKTDDWGVLRAWAWGASRALDYFTTDKRVDAKKVGIEGLSRYGKAALVTMAYDQRFAIGFIGSSGAGGAKIYRRIFGEQVENLAASGEYHWFAGNFIKYASGSLSQDDLPVDAHELVAMCAPRPVFISSGNFNGDSWTDPKGMFLAAAHASQVYQLLGKNGLGTMDFPAIETNLANGDVAFRQHTGGHTTGPNWPYFINFAKRYFVK